jgi:hypothetical protein
MRINDANLLQQVVSYLDRHREAVRIKKMLYCLCTSRWEKDTDYINSINSQYLIEQIVREQETLERFRVLLQNLIKTVNKPKQYIEVAKVIYLAIGQLYPEFQQQHGGKPQAAPPPPPTIPEPTESNIDRGIPSAIERAYTPAPTQAYTQGVASSIARAYTPAPTQAAYNTSQDIPSSLQRSYAPPPTQQFESQVPIDDDVDESAYETYYDVEIPSEFGEEVPAVSENRPEVPDYDPFVLRQNVMSYANPLRAKIVLLVMLHPQFNFGSQSAAAIREYQLDDLLAEVLKTYHTIHDLEESMTYAVEQLVEVEEYGKAATGLLQSLISIYAPATRSAR